MPLVCWSHCRWGKKTKRPSAGIYTKQDVKTLPKKEIEQIWKYDIIWGNLPKKEITIKGNNAYVSRYIYMILEEKNQEKKIKCHRCDRAGNIESHFNIVGAGVAIVGIKPWSPLIPTSSLYPYLQFAIVPTRAPCYILNVPNLLLVGSIGYLQEPAMYLRCSHWFPAPLTLSEIKPWLLPQIGILLSQ